jgi:hypothetical protein
VQGRVLLFDAVNGRVLPAVDAKTAIRVARSAWIGPQVPDEKASIVTEEGPEYRGSLPAWRVAFADIDATSVFVATDTGRIGGVRTGTWRLYDFFWSLHIMDWKNHEDFNTPWLLAFATGGLALGLAGTILLFMRWPITEGALKYYKQPVGAPDFLCDSLKSLAHLHIVLHTFLIEEIKVLHYRYLRLSRPTQNRLLQDVPVRVGPGAPR